MNLQRERKKIIQSTNSLRTLKVVSANLSKQLVDNMFGTTCTGERPTSGTVEVEGSTIYWIKDTTTEIITLTITDPNGL